MRYVSTRGAAPELPFHEAMLTGLARDGGLYVPAEVPTFSADDIRAMAGQSYEEIAFRVMRPFLGDSFTDAEFREDIAARRDQNRVCSINCSMTKPRIQDAPGMKA